MRTKDIKVGEFYAYFAWKGSDAQRVKVLETGVEQRQGRYDSRSTAKTGVRVLLDGRGERVVRSATIVRTWAEQEPIERAARERQEAYEARLRETYARRAALAQRIETRLAAHGVEATPQLGRKGRLPALVAAGFEKYVRADDRHQYVDARFDVDRFMTTGSLGEDVVALLLADVEAR